MRSLKARLGDSFTILSGGLAEAISGMMSMDAESNQ